MSKKVTHCRICNGNNIEQFFNLGLMPLPNGFLSLHELTQKEKLFPLAIGVCSNCWLAQLMDVVDPEIMFRNYVYIPSASKMRLDNFAQIVEQLTAISHPSKASLAVDIGSNDGSQLLEFKKIGIQTLGVDPAENLAKIAELKGIQTLNTYFSQKTAEKISKSYGQAHYITGTNVVAHIANLHDFFEGVYSLLTPSGLMLCEFPYLVDLLEKNLFDTIYQEHLSYFCTHPFVQLVKKHRLTIIRLLRTPIDGGALRVILAKDESGYKPDTTVINQLLDLEQSLRLHRFKPFRDFSKNIKVLKKSIRNTLTELKSRGKSIVGYGASARGNILMNYCNVSKDQIDFIVDSTPYKQGLYTPGTHLPILPEEELLKRQPDYVLILAWNFAPEIMQKQNIYKKRGGKFIIPVPHVKII